MEIKLLSPVDNSVVSILPPMQHEILSSLTKSKNSIDEEINWRNIITEQNDYSSPAYINFCWSLSGSLQDLQEINLLISKSENFNDAIKYSIMPGRAFISITNFNRATKYFWKMEALGENVTLFETKPFCFTTGDELPQWYFNDGITNLRDIGGWPTTNGKTVKEGMIFRGSEPDYYRKDIDSTSFFNNVLKVKTEVDLRLSHEFDASYKNICLSNYHQIPVIYYEKIASDEQKPFFRKLFSLLCEEDNYPIYLHCVAGADRTGTVVALLKALLGVAEDDIATDYELTSLSVYGTRSRHHYSYNAFINYLKSLDRDLSVAAEKYLLNCEITKEQISIIKDILLI